MQLSRTLRIANPQANGDVVVSVLQRRRLQQQDLQRLQDNVKARLRQAPATLHSWEVARFCALSCAMLRSTSESLIDA